MLVSPKTPSTNTLTRRQVTGAIAWTAPVVALAVAAPAAASSTHTPRVTSFSTTSTIGGRQTDNVFQDLDVTHGNFTLTAPPGVSTGTITLRIIVPVDYVAQRLDGTPLDVGTLINNGWRVSSKIAASAGRVSISIIHDGITTTSAATTQHAWFEGVLLHGSGANQFAQASQAQYRYATKEQGNFTDAYFPSSDE